MTDVPKAFHLPVESSVGMMAYLPLLPANSPDLTEYLKQLKEIAQSFSFSLNITLSIINANSLWGVIDIGYLKNDPIATVRGQNCIRQMMIELKKKGVYPQRVGVSTMDLLFDENDSYWETVKGLKRVLDPQNIIAPIRYNLRKVYHEPTFNDIRRE